MVTQALRKELAAEHAVTTPSAHFHHDNSAKRPDLIVEANRKWVVDVTIAYPLAASHVHDSAMKDACAAKKLEKKKDDKHKEATRLQGGIFMPFAVETFGRWGPRAETFVKEVAVSTEHAFATKCFGWAFPGSITCVTASLATSSELPAENPYLVSFSGVSSNLFRNFRQTSLHPKLSASRGFPPKPF